MTSSPWRKIQRESFTHWKQLADFLELDEKKRLLILKKSRFPLNLPVRLAQKIQKNCLDDPILKQFLPITKELEEVPGFTLDPVKDASFRRDSKLLHKYDGRALLVVTSACAMHCRYCFRQNFDYQSEKKGFVEELQLIREDRSISEIILSGGDPLSLSNTVLQELICDLEAIPHLHRLRFHTRFPIGIPERIDTHLLNILEKTRLQVWFVVHVNHAKELDEDVLFALKKIQKLGIPVLNQSVLLQGVNDSPEVLKELLETLVNSGILPYYLHQLDSVQGSAHFEVKQSFGKEFIAELSAQLPGYAIPKYVQEIPGKTSKTSLL